MKRSARIAALVLFLGAAILPGCSYLVDEDQSDCGGALRIDYRLRLVTNRLAELETVLPDGEDLPVRKAIESYLEGVFSDIAHDVDFSFYDEGGRQEHLSEVMDRENFELSIYLPAQTFLHSCVANVADSGPVSLEGDDAWQSAQLVQHSEEGVTDPQRTGLFTGRKTLEVKPIGEQGTSVDLFIANSATALVLETEKAEGVSEIKAYATGFADAFNVADSTWSFTASPLVRTDELKVESDTRRCFASVHFPSRDYRPETKSVHETVEPFLSEPAPEPLWEWRLYVRTADGTVTESLLKVLTPLRAGQLKILKAKVFDTGIVTVDDPTVGVSVTLDWHQGSSHEIEL